LERLSAFSTQPSVCSKDLDTVKNFRKLQVWHKAHELVVDVYEATRSFPRDADFARFLDIAMGSASELEYQLLLSAQLQVLGSPIHQRLDAATTEVKRMLASLLARLRADR